MKKVGKLTESSMVHAEEPKFYPLVSDGLFEAKVKVKKKLKEDDLDLTMNQTPKASKMTTNSPNRATNASVQVGGPYDLTDSQDWIQDAEEDIEKRGTKGKCTPITKEGCTGKAKALAKTFKKMSKRTKNESSVSGAPSQPRSSSTSFVARDQAREKTLDRWIAKNEKLRTEAGRTEEEPAERPKKVSVGSAVAANARKNLSSKEIEAINNKAAEWRGSLGSVGGTKAESTTSKPVRRARARAQAGRRLKKGTAKIVANDPGSEMGDRMAAAEKLS